MLSAEYFSQSATRMLRIKESIIMGMSASLAIQLLCKRTIVKQK